MALFEAVNTFRTVGFACFPAELSSCGGFTLAIIAIEVHSAEFWCGGTWFFHLLFIALFEAPFTFRTVGFACFPVELSSWGGFIFAIIAIVVHLAEFWFDAAWPSL